MQTRKPNKILETYTTDALFFDFGKSTLDLKKLSETLYGQGRYMRAVGVDNPVFVFTVPKEKRNEIEAILIRYFETMYHGKIKLNDAQRNPHGTMLSWDDFELPNYTKWHLPPMRCTILLLDQTDWGKTLGGIMPNKKYRGPLAKPLPPPKQFRRVNPISVQRRAALAEYNRLRKKFLFLHKDCKVCVIVRAPQPPRRATQVHHCRGRKGSNFLNVATWIASCAECHRWIHDNPKAARENGFLGSFHA